MALDLTVTYSGKVDATDSDYPYGKARNITVTGDGTGTPWDEDLINDLIGFFQKLLSDASVTPSGDPDNITDSDYCDALDVRIVATMPAATLTVPGKVELATGSETKLTYDSARAVTPGGLGSVISFYGDNISVPGTNISVAFAGTSNVLLGDGCGAAMTTGYSNTHVGWEAGDAVTTENNTSCLGNDSQVTGSNQVQLGNSSTTTYAYGSVQDRSDRRDKADVEDLDLGLKFIEKLRPVSFKWDYREDYNGDKDGTKKRNRKHHGLIAQEVKEVMDSLDTDFGGYQDHSVKGGKDVLSLGYQEFIAPLIKAIQELSSEVTELRKEVELCKTKSGL